MRHREHCRANLRSIILALHRGELDPSSQHYLAHILDTVLPREVLDLDWDGPARILLSWDRADVVLTNEVLDVDHELYRAKKAAERGEGARDS